MKEPLHDTAFFLTNPSFVRWVNDPIENPNIFWENWLENYPADEGAFKEAKAILRRIGFKKAGVSKKRQDVILANILEGKEGNGYKQRGFKLTSPWLRAIAAATMIGVMFTAFWHIGSNETGQNVSQAVENICLISPIGERTSICLPDSTEVVLNSGSILTYPETFMGDARVVNLEGEAFFDVAHRAKIPFKVVSGTVQTVVHGTQFKISAPNDDQPISIVLAEGSVSVHHLVGQNDMPSFDLVPGEKLTVHNDFIKSRKSAFDYNMEFGFKDGFLVFKDAGLEAFVHQVEQWYGVDVEIVGGYPEDWSLNGSFKNESLENVLASLQFSKGISYQINKEQITININ